MGIVAYIYDSASGRDSLSVFPQDAQRVLVVNADGPFEPREGLAMAKIVPGHGPAGTIRAVPLDAEGNVIKGTMKGYSFIYTSDSRFADLCRRIAGVPFYGAVALHDRLEG